MFRFDASRTVRIAIGSIVAVVAIIGAPADAAVVKHRKHLVHHHRTHTSVQMAQVTAPQSTLGVMRYYGGPKSPMWREAR